MNCDIYYDGECPFCTNFVQLSRLREQYTVRLLNLREHPEKVQEFLALGYDVDEGMVVDCDGRLYFGHEAVQFVGANSDDKKASGKVYRALFSSVRGMQMAYPYMRGARNGVLKILGRKKIKESL